MTKRFYFGKIAFSNPIRKINLVTVDIGLRPSFLGDQFPVFTCCCDVWNSKGTDIICGGQCLDVVKDYISLNKYLFEEIFLFWRKYHCNDLHAGTIAQEKIIKDTLNPHEYNFDAAKTILVNSGMLFDYDCNFELCNGGIKIDPHGNRYYEYGCGWVYNIIPEEDLIKIKELFYDCKN